MSAAMSIVTASFGTARGLVRLMLSYGEVALGAAGISPPDRAVVRRLVFVCHGNICRSAFADVVARQKGLRVA
jgi:protein-tyrosine phosphatase